MSTVLMEAILDMLRDDEVQPWSRIQQGELLRLLGRFDEAVAVLKAVPADGHSEVRAVKHLDSLIGIDKRALRQTAPIWQSGLHRCRTAGEYRRPADRHLPGYESAFCKVVGSGKDGRPGS
jgi:hypothetical protein